MDKTNWQQLAVDTTFTVRNFIGGRQEHCLGKTPIEKRSPRDGRLLYSFKEGDGSEVDRAVESARAAFDDGRWRNLPQMQRKAVLIKLADLIEEHTQTFALYESLDVGKPIQNALGDDVPSAARELRECVEGADKLLAASGADGAHFVYQVRKPVGVVAAIIGWNFPLCLAVSKVGPVLATGSSLVLKPSEFTALSANLLAALAVEAGVPAGVFNVVNGVGGIVGAALAKHMGVDLLSFVGSSATGKQLMKYAGDSNMKRLILECGGKSPFLVFDDCSEDLDALAENIVETAFPNQGALCVAGTRLLIHASLKNALVPKIIELTRAIKPQDPLESDTRFGALINEAHLNKVLSYIDSGREEGAELIYGGNQILKETGGYYLEPAIFDRVKLEHKIAQEEIFGPVLSIFTFSDEDEAIQLANSTCFGLCAYVATENLGRAQRLGQRLSAGSIIVFGTSTPSGDGVNIGAEGQRESGFGFEGGQQGLLAYTVASTVHVLT